MALISIDGYHRPAHVARHLGMDPGTLHRLAHYMRVVPVPTHVVGTYKRPLYSPEDVRAITEYVKKKK